MQTTILRFTLLVAVMFLSLGMNAQIEFKHERFSSAIDSLRTARSKVEIEEKDFLKKGIENLQKQLKNEEITIDEFEREKKKLAELHAKNIESRTLIIDESIEYLKRNDSEGSHRIVIGYKTKKEREEEYKSFSKDTTINAPIQSSGMGIAFGFVNTTGDYNINDSSYEIAGSRFFEISYVWRTAFKQNGPLHLRYGFNYQIDSYKPVDNQYFVMEDKKLHLEEFPMKLKKSKLRIANLVVPLHLEFSKAEHKVFDNGKNVYTYHDSWRFGIGGYVGMNLKATQKLKYKEDGSTYRMKENMSSGVNQAVYGLSAYLGKGSWALYTRYGFNNLLKNSDIKENTIAVGVKYKN